MPQPLRTRQQIQINLELNFKYTELDDRLANNKENWGIKRKLPDLN